MADTIPIILYFLAMFTVIFVVGFWSKRCLKESWDETFERVTIVVALAVVLILALTFVQPHEVFQEITALTAVLGLMFALAITASNAQKNLNNYRKNVNLDTRIQTIQDCTQSIFNKLTLMDNALSELKQQDLSPEGNSKRIIPSELRDDGDTKTLTTQYTSDNVTVTSTIKITLRRE